MTVRTARVHVLLAGLAALVLAAFAGTPLAYLAAGCTCIACALLLIRLDGLGKRRRTRR